jgi:RsiW-degrading membrane proteinase PrsW (M82 family)
MIWSSPTPSTPDFTASAGVTAAAPSSAPTGVAAQAAASVQRGLATPTTATNTRLVLGIIGVVLTAMISLFVVTIVIDSLGVDAFALGGVMALIPLGVVFFVIRWIDRWEPEPRLAVLFAFLWGAGVAVVIALLVGAEIDGMISGWGVQGLGYEFFGAVVQAPIVEEGGKGLGILILLFAARKNFDGPVDGLVYAAWLAGGFAFTENILYFGSELNEAGGFDSSISEIFLVRGIMSPFAHVMFTAFIGVALGFAARRAGVFGTIGFFLLGLIPAVLLHALWNGALFVVPDFFGYYIVVQMPLFAIAVGIVFLLRRQEAKLTRDRLTEYAVAGWFDLTEVNALATPAGRRQALAWARAHGKRVQMKAYLKNATKLAFARQRIITGREKIGAQADEATLLGAILESRTALVVAGPSRLR